MRTETMARWAAPWLLALGFAGSCAAANRPTDAVTEAEQVMTMRLRGELDFDAEGKVTGYKVTTPNVDNAILGVVDKAIARWRFQPVQKDGKPALGRTYMFLTLAARGNAAGNYLVQLENARFDDRPDTLEQPSPKRNSREAMQLARIPNGRQMAGDMMQVVRDGAAIINLYARVSPDGDLLDLAPAQSSVLDAKGEGTRAVRVHRALLDAAIRGMRGARFKLQPDTQDPENRLADGSIVGILPILYVTMGRTTTVADGQWRHEARSVRLPSPWKTGENLSRVSTSDDLGNGELETGSRYKLVEGAPST